MALSKKQYVDAIQVQDASNIMGVMNSFVILLDLIESEMEVREPGSKLELNRHPLCVMYTSKILSLSKGELMPKQDLRILPGWQLKLFANCLMGGLRKMRDLGKDNEEYGLIIDNKFLDGHAITRWMAVKMAELTHCESMDVFGQAYEACKFVSDLDEGEAVDAIADEDWLHRVMMPDTPIERQEAPDTEDEVDWACECGASGVTRMLEFVEEANKFRCNACGSQNITAVSASLKAELNSPRMLAFALGQLNADKIRDAGFEPPVPLVAKESD